MRWKAIVEMKQEVESLVVVVVVVHVALRDWMLETVVVVVVGVSVAVEVVSLWRIAFQKPDVVGCLWGPGNDVDGGS